MSESLVQSTQALFEKVSQLETSKPDKPTLVYFDIIGIAWPIRCLLHLKDVDYNLIQISIAQWIQTTKDGDRVLKRSFPNGHVPLYVDDDVYLNQSIVIMSYLAEKHGMMPEKPHAKLAAMEVMSHAYDALFHWNGMLQIIIKMGISDQEVDNRLKSFLGEGVWGLTTDGYKNHLDGFARYLDANPTDSGFIASDELCIADLHAFNVLCNWYKAFEPERFRTSYPQLDSYIQRIAAIPGVRNYIDNKQEATTWFQRPEVAIKLTSPQELRSLIG